MNTLKIAIQKKGRLNEDSLQLLRSCGIKLDNGVDQLKVTTPNFPLEVFYLRNSDIPQYLEDGVVDVGIVGENLLEEAEANVEIIQKLGFAKCRLSLAVANDAKAIDVNYFEGRRIATSYPKTTAKYLRSKNVNAEIHVISGSVEIAPNIGLADGICDIVSTGSTLFKNNLRELETISESEAVLARSPILTNGKKDILDRLLFRINAVQRANGSKYVLLNVPNEKIEAVSSILPVLKSPTVLPLTEPGWSSLHSVIDEQKFWEVIDELKAAGAEDILVVPINKMVL